MTSTSAALAAHLPYDDVLTSARAIAIYGRGRVRAQLAAHRWQAPVRGVVVVHNGPLTDEQTDRVALLGCAPSAVLAGLTALTYDGLDGFTVDERHVVVREGKPSPAPAGGAPTLVTRAQRCRRPSCTAAAQDPPTAQHR